MLSLILLVLFFLMEPPISLLVSLLVGISLLLMIGFGSELFRMSRKEPV
jgi:hypothetical protein